MMVQKPKSEVVRGGLEAETKVKLAVVDWAGRILVPTRSPREGNRPGSPDLIGGSADVTDTVTGKNDRFDLLRTTHREGTTEELLEVAFSDFRLLGFQVDDKQEGGTVNIKTSVALAAIARFSPEGIILGRDSDGEFEHVAVDWPHHTEVPELDGLPNKWKRMIAANGPIFEELAELQQDRAGEPPVPLSARSIRELGAQGLLMGQEAPLPQGGLAFEPALQPATA